jgi:hypothetical protein
MLKSLLQGLTAYPDASMSTMLSIKQPGGGGDSLVDWLGPTARNLNLRSVDPFSEESTGNDRRGR